MAIEFWVPLIIGLISIVWNYFQSKRLVKVELEAKSKNVVHRFQFEKEFEIYKEIWPKLVELNSAAKDIDKELGRENQRNTEIQEALKKLEINYHLVRDYFERNKPFYSEKVYDKIQSLLIVLSSEVFWASSPLTAEFSERRLAQLKKVIAYIDDIASMIRKRINFND